MENNNAAQLIGALLLGTAVGGALGILFAPDKGSETRKKIVAKGDDLTDAMKEKFNSFLEDMKREVEIVKDQANDLVERGLAKTDHIGTLKTDHMGTVKTN